MPATPPPSLNAETTPYQPLHVQSMGYTAKLPDFCNLGSMLRLLVLVNIMLAAAVLIRAEGIQLDFMLRDFLTLSVVAQPAILFSLIAMCAMKRIFIKLTYWQGVSAIFALELFIGAGFYYLHMALLPLIPLSDRASLIQYVLLFLLVTGVVLFYFDLRARSLAPALTEARLQALQARIRPHFLFNSINAVLSLIRDEPRRAERMLEDMADLFRVLMADNRKLHPLADELALCRRYLDIEQIRLGERLNIVWQIDNMPPDTLVPPLILQPLIENAVYHGIEPAAGSGTLTISITVAGRVLTILLSNPYHGQSSHVGGNRMAIANIRERLQLHFDAEAGLRADVRDTNYIVTIHLPITKNEQPSQRM
jgi:two-component system, LytTR family, sensor histidine kinase AlgZ